MDGLETAIIGFVIFAVHTNAAVTPDVCNANFRWDDCGGEPTPAMYYWKPGSRCEVGIWRGCRPALNMFKNEYECVSTCIFGVRAQDTNWHNVIDDTEEESGEKETSDDGESSDESESAATEEGSGENNEESEGPPPEGGDSTDAADDGGGGGEGGGDDSATTENTL